MQVSWIDPDEIARLAAELNGPLPSAEPTTSWDLNTLPDVTGDALLPQISHLPPQARNMPEVPETPAPVAHPELDHIREKLRAIRSRAQEAGLLPKKEEPPVPAELPSAPHPVAPTPALAPENIAPPPAPAASAHSFLNLDGSLTERLASFMTWAERYAPSKEILLVDDHGELLWGNPSHPELALSAILAANVSLRSGAQALSQQPAATLNLSEDKHLTVLPCTTRFGVVTLALLNAEPRLTEEQISCLREALTLSVEGKADGH